MKTLGKQWWQQTASAILLILGAVLMYPHGDLFKTDNLIPFWCSAAVMAAGFGLSWGIRVVPMLLFWSVAISTRLILLGMEPGDDIWRYLWEGGIQLKGFSPYNLAPNASVLESLRTEWWHKINHPDTSAIYPPIAQLLFRFHAAIGQKVLVFKSSFTLADLAICWLLAQRFGTAKTTLYAWNPLVIYGFSGGGHYDSWFLLPLVAAWLLTENTATKRKTRQGWVDVLLGISVGVKWITLPLLIQRGIARLNQTNPYQKVAFCIAISLAPLMISSLLYCNHLSCPLVPTSSTFVSHGRSAEWLPYWLGRIWPWTTKSNLFFGILLVPCLSIATWKIKNFGALISAYMVIILLLSPVVHAWYFIWLIPFAVPTQNWGARLISLSAFIYFVLPSRLPDWQLSTGERLALWLPLLLGWLTSIWLARRKQTDWNLQL